MNDDLDACPRRPFFGHHYVKPEGLGPRVCAFCEADEPPAARAARALRDPRQAALLPWEA